MTGPSRFSPEVRARAVRMVVEYADAHESQSAPLVAIAEEIGCPSEPLRKWVRQTERERDTRPGLTTEERERLEQLGRESGEPRRFKAERPNELWVADPTYAAPWCGVAYVSLVIDVFSWRVVGWRVSSSLRSALARDALEQALDDRRQTGAEPPVHHGDRGGQYLSVRYGERLAETVVGLYETEGIGRCGPWKTIEHVEVATLAGGVV